MSELGFASIGEMETIHSAEIWSLASFSVGIGGLRSKYYIGLQLSYLKVDLVLKRLGNAGVQEKTIRKKTRIGHE